MRAYFSRRAYSELGSDGPVVTAVSEVAGGLTSAVPLLFMALLVTRAGRVGATRPALHSSCNGPAGFMSGASLRKLCKPNVATAWQYAILAIARANL